MCRHSAPRAHQLGLLLAGSIAFAIGCDSSIGGDAPPAHIEVSLSWDTEDNLDLVVHRTIPDDTVVDKDNPSAGGCTHSGDDPGSASGGNEMVNCPAPAQTGWYVLQVLEPAPDPNAAPPVAELRVNANGVVTTTQETIDASVCSAGLDGELCRVDADCDSPPGSGNGICEPGATRNVVLFFRD